MLFTIEILNAAGRKAVKTLEKKKLITILSEVDLENRLFKFSSECKGF